MITVDLREIPIFVLNLKDDHKRRAFMCDQLNALELNHQFIRAVKCNPSPVGIALSHLKTLRQIGRKPPFLILEDDCKIVPHNFIYRYDIPPEIDALYLGHSVFGLQNEKDQQGIRWERRGNVKFKQSI